MFGNALAQVFGAGSQSTDDRLARRGRENKILEAQQKGTAAASAILMTLPQPWGLLAAASAALTSLGFKVAILVRGRGDKILTGDAKAIAGFIRRAGRWNGAKRKRVAMRLHKQLARLLARAKRKGADLSGSDLELAGREERAERKEARQERRASRRGGKGKVGDTLAVHIKAHQMKIAALVALEVGSHQNPNTPLVGDEPATVPALVEADPASGMPDASEAAYESESYGGIPLTYWIGGAAAVGVLAIVLARSGRETAHA